MLFVAPMMDWTDRHCRFFHRLLAPTALLYTEMVTAAAIRHGDRPRLLGFDPAEQPVALQVGGSDPRLLAQAAEIGEEFGYREINLNVGCPSDRVQEGRFGACLMAEPALVGACLGAMRQAVRVPVTVKCRIGIDDQDTEATLDRFVDEVARSGCETVIVHARKAWLKGLSPKENREIPPLDYERVYRLKQSHPGLRIIINGGIAGHAAIAEHLAHVDGVMLGRAAYRTPWFLAEASRRHCGAGAAPGSRLDAVERMKPYIDQQLKQGICLARITRHLLGLYHGEPGGRLWRRILSEQSHRPGAGLPVIDQALAAVESSTARAAA